MAALETRAFVQAGNDCYLTPLARTGKAPDLLRDLLKPVWERSQRLQRIYAINEDHPGQMKGESRPLALGYEALRQQKASVESQTITWSERVLVVYSPTLARRARRGLTVRLERAEQKVLALTPPRGRGKRQWDDLEALQAAVQSILKKHRVTGLLEVQYRREVERRKIRRYRDHPTRTEERVRYAVQVERDRSAIADARRLMGWRLYTTNAPKEELPLDTAVQAYRQASSIERNFRRLKGRPLGIRPLYVRREDHTKGMAHLLTLALRVLTMVEHVVRRSLRSTGEALQGLYAGNPTRRTARPTTERLLKAFRGITLTTVQLPDQVLRHVTPLSDLQCRILMLLELPVSIYEDLILPNEPIPP